MTRTAGYIFSVLALHAGNAAAEYPERPVRVIVGAAAGSAPDTNVRLLVAELTNQLGRQFVVDNRSGAGGSMGKQLLARATPDGYTIGYGNTASLAIARSTIAKLPYDLDRDFQPVSLISHTEIMLAGALTLPVKTVPELIDHAKKNPGTLVYGSGTMSTTYYLAGQMFNQLAGTQIKPVVFLGVQAIPAMTLGQVHITFNGIAALEQYVRSGRIRGIAVTSLKRSAAFPDLPAVAETLPGFEVTAWGGIIVPAGVPRGIVARLNGAIHKALAAPAMLDKFKMIGVEPAASTPAEFAAYIRNETAKWAGVVRAAGIKPD